MEAINDDGPALKNNVHTRYLLWIIYLIIYSFISLNLRPTIWTIY